MGVTLDLNMKIDLTNKKILVTGATGFIGGRLVEKLILEQHADVTVLIRKYDNAARLARFDNIRMVKVDLHDFNGVENLIKDCDIIFHLAYDPTSQENNLKGIDAIAQSCIKYSKKLVHTSTISVYEPLEDKVVNENSKAVPCGITYADRKLEIEESVLNFCRQGLNAIILQPTIVYGPFCAPWTNRPATQLLSGTVILPNGGNGICNAVYVDDVCGAMLTAAVNDNVVGDRFLISGDNPITWKEFYQAFANTLNINSIEYMSTAEIKKISFSPVKSIKLILGDPKRAVDWEPLKSFLISLKYKLPSSFKSWIKFVYGKYKKISPKPVFVPNKQMFLLYDAPSIVEISKAKEKLGYNPQFSFEEGMQRTSEYLKWAFRS